MTERKILDEEGNKPEEKTAGLKKTVEEEKTADPKKTVAKEKTADPKKTATEEKTDASVKKTSMKKTDAETIEKKSLKKASRGNSEKGAPRKKKNIIGVFRPQNSQTGMVKPGSRPRPDGSGSARPAGTRPAGKRPAGTRPAGTRSAGMRPAGMRPAGARPAGTRPAGANPEAAKTVNPEPAGTKSTGIKQGGSVSAGTKQAGTVSAGANQGGTVSAGTKQAEAISAGTKQAEAISAGTKQAGSVSAGTKPAETISAGTKPAGTIPERTKPAGTIPERTKAAGTRTAASRSEGTKAAGSTAAGTKPAGTGASSARPSGKPTPSAEAGNSGASAAAKSALKTETGKTNSVKSETRKKSSEGTAPSERKSAQAKSAARGTSAEGNRAARSSASKTRESGRGSTDKRKQATRAEGANRSRNQEGRGGRGSNYAAPQADAKSREKEGRKRSERGDRNRDRGDKLDRLEKNARSNQRNNARNEQRNSAKGGPRKGQGANAPAAKTPKKQEETIRTLTLPEQMTVGELASALKITPAALIKKLLLQGMMVTVNEEIDFDKAEEIALEYNCICEKEKKVNVLEDLLKDEEDSPEKLKSRPPVVCVMGHVDHGKTSLLDAIRDTHVIDREAGGITQHIGAYMVSINDRKITFLDTPGHEAFTAMRMRGANSTDIAILVVAADDGVMPQTVEAINHAKAAGIEIIVAINKIDKPSANVERVKQELSEYDLIPEDWGGSTIMVPVSAHTHEGIDDLLEMILLTADVLELQANPERKARGLVIEAELDKGKGPVATVLVQKGTLRIGDPVAAGSSCGKVRAMMDENGLRVEEAGPSTPVEILGLSDVPNAGDTILAMDSEKEARNFAETFYSEGREKMIEDTKLHMSLDDLYEQIQAGKLKELDLIIKADVQGSVEALKQSLLKLSNDEVVVKVIHSGVGSINESDVVLASASNAVIIGFNIRPDAIARDIAERENVDIRLYNVIYDAIADVESAMKGMLEPIYEEKIIGHAQIRQLFKASSVGMIAGSYVTDGMVQRNCRARITRDGKLIFEGPLASLKRFKDDVKEVKSGYECGLVFEKFNDIKVDDLVEVYVMEEVSR